MLHSENKITDRISIYVEELLRDHLPEGHNFHNLDHTRMVVRAAGEISDFLSIPDNEKEVVVIAAWFHDSGHIIKCDGHEEESKLIARKFLKETNFPVSKTEWVIQCIESTKIPQRPKDLLGQILCDADLYHLGASNYFEQLGQLRAEWAQIRNEEYMDKDWFEMNLNFLRAHRYFTKYGKEVLEGKKESVIRVLEMACKFFED